MCLAPSCRVRVVLCCAAACRARCVVLCRVVWCRVPPRAVHHSVLSYRTLETGTRHDLIMNDFVTISYYRYFYVLLSFFVYI